jgi:pyruvate/2-oxoglutarate dehydrogenase complex dihydrolipoamide dehydrogenase (E3) component
MDAIAVQTFLERNGKFLLNAKVVRSDRAGPATKLQIQVADRELELQGSHLLVAVGRDV